VKTGTCERRKTWKKVPVNSAYKREKRADFFQLKSQTGKQHPS